VKHADLIRAALDGKEIQWSPGGAGWQTFLSPDNAIYYMTGRPSLYQYRIKPEPKPDTVYYDVVRRGKYTSLETLKEGFGHMDGEYCVKLTINGETGEKTVEIVE
jgi:hypothetical protein